MNVVQLKQLLDGYFTKYRVKVPGNATVTIYLGSKIDSRDMSEFTQIIELNRPVGIVFNYEPMSLWQRLIFGKKSIGHFR